MLARFMYVETQSVEGLNSIIRLQSKRCPNISLELLSSRLTIKRLIGQADGQTGCRKRWSTVKDLAATEVASLCDQATPCLQVLACQTRWAPADTIPIEVGKEHGLGAGLTPQAIQNILETHVCELAGGYDYGIPTRAIEWAKSYNLGWKWVTGGGSGKKKTTGKMLKQNHSVDGIGMIILPSPTSLDDLTFHIVVERFSHSVAFSRLTPFSGDGGVDCLRWQHDRSMYADSIESTAFFQRYYHACVVEKKSVNVKAVFLTTEKCYSLFVSPGYVPAATMLECSVDVFTMSAEFMKGAKPNTGAKKRRYTRKVNPQSQPSGDPVDDVDADTDAGNAENMYMDDVTHGLCDMSDESHASSDEECADVDGDASEITARELLATRGGGRGNLPSAKHVSACMDTMASSASSVPAPVLEEEALLLLVRRANAKRKGTKLDGVGDVGDVDDADGDSSRFNLFRGETSQVNGDDDNSDSSEDGCSEDELDTAAWPHLEGVLGDIEDHVATLAGCVDTPSCATTTGFRGWYVAFLSTVRAMNEVHGMQKNRRLGEERSLSLILMGNQPVHGCQCIRCKHGCSMDDCPDVLLVSWLNNFGKKTGLVGRSARQVNLDSDNKVLYSIASSGAAAEYTVGFPSIQADEEHCEVLVAFVGASMKKLRKTDGSRDAVSDSCLRVRAFCERMVMLTFAVEDCDYQEIAAGFGTNT